MDDCDFVPCRVRCVDLTGTAAAAIGGGRVCE